MSSCSRTKNIEGFLGPLGFLNPFSDCKSWIYWIIIAILLLIIIFS